jgi:hypothetical protein
MPTRRRAEKAGKDRSFHSRFNSPSIHFKNALQGASTRLFIFSMALTDISKASMAASWPTCDEPKENSSNASAAVNAP